MANTIYIDTKTPLADAIDKAKALPKSEGYEIREYFDGTVGLYTNNFKPFIFRDGIDVVKMPRVFG